jgi:Protein of unknown function (DUF2852)
MSQTASGTFEQTVGADEHPRRGCRKGKTRWSAFELGAMILGFVVFWPLGLLALFVKFKNGEMWPGAAEGTTPWAAWKMPNVGNWQTKSYGFAATGNAAFDDYKRTQLARLEEERRKLDEEQKAFRDHLHRLRKAKDQEEFDRFMAERNAPPQA